MRFRPHTTEAVADQVVWIICLPSTAQAWLRLNPAGVLLIYPAAALRSQQERFRGLRVDGQPNYLSDFLGQYLDCQWFVAPSDAQKMPLFMSHLAATIEKAFAVKCVFSWRRSSAGNLKRVVSFYGQDGRDVVAAYAFDVLTRQLQAARRKFKAKEAWRYKNPITLADKFCEGWASGAYHAVTALVLSEEQGQQMEAYAEKMKSDGVAAAKTRDAKKCNGHLQAARLGYSEGKNAKIHHGVSTAYQAPAAIDFKADGGFDA